MLLLGWQDFAAGASAAAVVLLFALVFGVIGYIDDYVKVKKHQNTGLTAAQKFLLQLAAAIVFTVLMRNDGYLTPDLYIPFVNVTLSLPWPVYMVFAAFVMVGTVNAVNITDGIDGLATGVTMPVALFFTAVAASGGNWSWAIFSAALFGGLCGFLIYNFHPAKVFMGDTGSLFLGGVVCGLAFALDIPLVLILVGIIYIAGDPVRHSPGGLLQADPRQADLPHGAPAPPPGAGRLERGEAVLCVLRRDPAGLCAGLSGRDGPYVIQRGS